MEQAARDRRSASSLQEWRGFDSDGRSPGRQSGCRLLDRCQWSIREPSWFGYQRCRLSQLLWQHSSQRKHDLLRRDLWSLCGPRQQPVAPQADPPLRQVQISLKCNSFHRYSLNSLSTARPEAGCCLAVVISRVQPYVFRKLVSLPDHANYVLEVRMPGTGLELQQVSSN